MQVLTARTQKGFSLVIVMLLFLALTVVGIAVLRSGVLSEKQAINIQEKSATFHAAQSSNMGIINSYHYDKTHIYKVVDASVGAADLMTHTQARTTCVFDNGDVGDCDEDAYIDNNESGVMRGSTDSYYRACHKALRCLGTSADIDSDSKIGCNLFEHDGTGFLDNVNTNQAVDAGESSSEINEWTTLVAACEVSS